MTQIFTGEGLGVNRTLTGLGGYGPKGSASLGQGGQSVYVNAANGNLVLRESDGFIANTGFGLDLCHIYNSRVDGNSNWCFNMQTRLEFSGKPNTPGSVVIRVDEEGHRVTFSYNSGKQIYLSNDGGTSQLSFNQKEWIFHEGNQKSFSCYNQQGQLIEIRDLDGHSFKLKYNNGLLTQITDNSGKQDIKWVFENGLLRDLIVSSDNKTVHHQHYEYDQQNRLHKVSRDLGNGKSYWIAYDYTADSNWISSIRQSDGTALYIEYDAGGKVKKLIDGENRITIYEYGEGKTLVTNSLGESWTYYYDSKNRLTGVDGPELYRIRYHYEGSFLSSIKQGNQIWKFSYNHQGDCTQIEEPSGQVTQRIYDSGHRLLSETRYQILNGKHHPEKPVTTRYVYDEHGHLLFTIAPDGSVKEMRYDNEGKLISSHNYLFSNYDLSTLTPNMLVGKEELQLWVVKQNSRDVSLTDYRYDWRGQLIEEINYAEVDSRGYGIVKNSLSTYSRYDASGHLVEKSKPTVDGRHITQYFYDDLGRLIHTLDNQQQYQVIDYDDAHQRIIHTDANGLQTISLYDRSGLLLSVSRLDHKQSYGTVQYKYDAAGRMIAETGVGGLSTYIFYDQQGRVQARVNSSGLLTQYIYNEEGYLLITHEYQHQVSTIGWLEQFPEFAQIKPQISKTDHISQNVYNDFGQVVFHVTGEGAVTGFSYDAQGHLLTKTAYSTRLSHFDPGKLLNCETINVKSDNKDRMSIYYYDLLGRLEGEVDAEGYAKAYHYDHFGNLIESTHFYNQSQKKLIGDWSKDKPLVDKSRDIHTYIFYDKRGLKTAEIDGEGYVTEYRYDTGGFIKEKCTYITVLPKSVIITEKTTIESIRPEKQQNDHHIYYRYNNSGQLIEEKTQAGLVINYAYDEMNQLISKTLRDVKTRDTRQKLYRYDSLGRVTQALDESGCALLGNPNLNDKEKELIWRKHGSSFEYSDSGLLLSKTDALGHMSRYFYDHYARIQYSVNADGSVTETEFNSFNQITATKKYSNFIVLKKNQTSKDIHSQLELIKDADSDEIIHYEYNAVGQLVTKTIGNSNQISMHYNAFNEIEINDQKINSTKSTITVLNYDRRGLLNKTINDFYGAAKSTTFEYNSFGGLTKKTNGLLNSTIYTLNKRGEQIALITAGNSLKTFSYDAFGRLLNESDFTHSKILKKYSYDDKNNSFRISFPEENTQIITQNNAFGDKISVIDANGFKTHFYYDEKGQFIKAEYPEHRTVQYKYDETGNLILQQEYGGRIIKYSYDADGHKLSKIIDSEGLNLITCYRYDAVGRQIEITEADGSMKQFIYDCQGNLIQSCIDPLGLHLITEFTYDDRQMLIRQTQLNARGTNKTIDYQWDNLGRKVAVIEDPEGLKLATQYEYDANDNLISQTDANQHKTSFIYDVNDRCCYKIDPRGVVTEYSYDVNGNQIQTVTYAKRINPLRRYNESTVKTEIITDLQDQYQFFMFDSTGKIISFYDALGYLTTYKYDGKGNLLHQCQYAKAVSVQQLKRGNRPLPSGVESRNQYFAYDGLNQLRFKWDDRGYVIESQYDSEGQLVKSIKYVEKISLDVTTNYSIENISNKILSNLEMDQVSHYAYDLAGRLITEISPQGAVKSYSYDKIGNIISTTSYAIYIKKTFAQLISNLQMQTNSSDRTTRFVYDAAGREIFRVSSEGRVLERRYDAVGNIIAECTHSKFLHLSNYTEKSIKTAIGENSNGRVTEYKYDDTGRLITQINSMKDTIYYKYDAENNVSSKSEANHALWTYRYDEANQLIETISPKIQVSSAKGTQKRSIITRTIYDSFGNIIAIIKDAEGLKQTQYFEYDSTNHKVKTIYPDVKINNASLKSSSKRQEINQTLFEEIQYNSYGEIIATSDKSASWKHFIHDKSGSLVYSVDERGGLIHYKYDSFGRLIAKSKYAKPVSINKFTTEMIESTLKTRQSDDRHEYYYYDADNHLIEVSRDPVRMFNPKSNHYDSSIKSITRNVYNSFGDVIKSSIKLNETEWADTYNYYDKEGNKTATIDAEGYLTSYKHTVYGEIEELTEHASIVTKWSSNGYSPPPSNNKDRKVVFTYDGLGRLLTKTLKKVSFERKKNNDSPYETIIRDLTTTFGYDPMGNVTVTTDAKGNVAYCYYDQLGRVIAKIAPKTKEGRAATTYSYDAHGQLKQTQRWSLGALEADEQHFKLKGMSSQDIITRLEYDNQGHVIADTDPLNHTIYHSYDANGNLARSWTSFKQVDNTVLIQDKRYTYDKNNQLVQTAAFKNNGDIKTEDAQYNIFGELTAKGINGKFNIHNDYDSLGRVWRSNMDGYYQIFVYDLMDRITQIVTSTNGFRPEHGEKGLDLSNHIFDQATRFDKDSWRYDLQRQNNVYDANGRLLSQTKDRTVDSKHNKNPGLQRICQSQKVDRWGNIIGFTNSLGFYTQYEYNAFNQVIKQNLPEIKVVDEHGVEKNLKPVNYYAYDELGQALAMTDANGHTVSKDYDAMGHIIRETDAKGNHRLKHYNLLDQLSYSANELGGITTYFYDQMNRLISIDTPKTHKEYQYDAAGQLIKQINGTNEEIDFWYDTLGNQIKRRDARGYSTHLEYDDSGHKIKEIDSAGRSQTWIYNDTDKVKQHTDLGGHINSYKYNTNGLLIEETAKNGKHLKYWYQSDGSLIQYSDEALHEVVNFTYDSEGQTISKEAGRDIIAQDGWLRETDQYQYDALGRLIKVRRRNPDDKDTRFPDTDHALLSIDYSYDAVGNIRHTQIKANYTGYKKINNDDYYTYDENNRMIVNKGQLLNGSIMMTPIQGSTMSYDAAGNILDAEKYENGSVAHYHYLYNKDNQLELIKKNNISIQSKSYDRSGRIIQENLFDTRGNISQKNTITYDKGLLAASSIKNSLDNEISRINYKYDKVGNMTDLEMRVNSQGRNPGYDLKHHYSYALWGGYQQSTDEASQTIDHHLTTYGKSTRSYDVNGLLTDSFDEQTDGSGKNNTTHYKNSSIDGIKAREDKDGQTSYLSVAGKNIADLRLDKMGKQLLTVYGGFSPAGSSLKADSLSSYRWSRESRFGTINTFLERQDSRNQYNGELPESTQDNMGAYTLKAGDTLESIALQIYGDSSLWYLLADANGINEKNTQASNSGILHVGKRITIPQIAVGQHHSSATHKVINANQIIGNTSASTPLPPAAPPLPTRNKGLFSKIVLAVVAVVTTVLTAGIIGALAGVCEGLGSLFSIGTSVLSGGVMPTLSGTLAAGFTAGFIGNLTTQGVANTLGVQNGIDLKGALITGLATAATAGLTRGLNGSTSYKQLINSVENVSVSKSFNTISALEMMEQNAATQGLNVALRKHEHFDWEELGLTGISAGFLGGTPGKQIDKVLRKIDGNTGILSSELRALTTAAQDSVSTGAHFNAIDVLKDNIGSVIGSGIISLDSKQNEPGGAEDNYELHDELYLTDTVLDTIHPERTQDSLILNYLAHQLDGGGYDFLKIVNQENNQILDNYNNLIFESDLIRQGDDISNFTLSGKEKSNSINKKYKQFIEFPKEKKFFNELKDGKFKSIQNKVFEHEGIINNNKNDFGGYTNMGITFETFKLYARKDLGLAPTLSNLKKLTYDQASLIYNEHFWKTIKADEINSFSLTYALYDFHVNAPGSAVKMMQESINLLGGNLIVDNKMGSKTIDAINSLDACQLFDIYQNKRVDYYIARSNKIPSQKVFLNGWLNRVSKIKFEG